MLYVPLTFLPVPVPGLLELCYATEIQPQQLLLLLLPGAMHNREGGETRTHEQHSTETKRRTVQFLGAGNKQAFFSFVTFCWLVLSGLSGKCLFD